MASSSKSIRLEDISAYLECPRKALLLPPKKKELSLAGCVIRDTIKLTYLHRDEDLSWSKVRRFLDRSFQRWVVRIPSTTEVLHLYERVQAWWNQRPSPLEELVPNLPIRVPMGGVQFEDEIDLVKDGEIWEIVEVFNRTPHDFVRHFRAWGYELQTFQQLSYYNFLQIRPRSVEYVRVPWNPSLYIQGLLNHSLSGLRNAFYPPIIGRYCEDCVVRESCYKEDSGGLSA